MSHHATASSSALITAFFPSCGHMRTRENTAKNGTCRTCHVHRLEPKRRQDEDASPRRHNAPRFCARCERGEWKGTRPCGNLVDQPPNDYVCASGTYRPL